MSRSEKRPDSFQVDSTRQKVDAAFFRPEDAPNDGRPHWVDQILPIEFKSRKEGNKFDPFDDRDGAKIESGATKRKESRGQIITYANLLFYLQHRIFLVMLCVIGRRFRFLRWDYAGALVTKSVDYYENPELLCEFLWRISYLSPVQLGLDPTAVRLHIRPDHMKAMDDILKYLRKRAVDYEPDELTKPLRKGYVFQYVLDMFEKSIECLEFPRYELKITDGGETRSFIVGRPAFRGSGALGGCIRGWVAYDTQDKCLVWLKDTWRPWSDSIEKEGDVLRRLNAASVEGVPTVVCHGDIEGQVTITGLWWESKNPVSQCEPSSPVLTTAVSAQPPQTHLHSPYVLSSRAGSTSTALSTNISGTSRNVHQGPDFPAPQSSDKKRKRDCDEQSYHVPSFVPIGRKGPSPRFRPDCPIQHYRHYRIVEQEVCLPLKEFRSPEQLVSIIFDCILGEYIRHSR